MQSRIAMLSVHGYVDAVPRLGATDTGGQVVYVLELAKALARSGYEVDIYTRQFEGRAAEEPVREGVRIVRIPCGPDEFIPKEEAIPIWDEFADNMKDFLAREQLSYGVFHSHYWDAGWVAMQVTSALEQGFVHCSHSLGAWKREQFRNVPGAEEMFRFEERIARENRVFRAARRLIATNPEEVDNYQRFYGFEPAAIDMIPPGVDVRTFRPLQEGEEETPTDLPDSYILALARVDHNKGFDLLIHAFARLAERHPELHLVIGGGSPRPKQPEIDLRQSLEDLAREYGLEDRVLLYGYVPDELMAPFYRGARAFVLSSRFEPFGMTVTEAMACGTPVVVTSLGGIRHYLQDGQDALLADPTDTEALAGALDSLLTRPRLAEEIARAGLDTIYRTFTWDAIAAQHLQVYQELLAES